LSRMLGNGHVLVLRGAGHSNVPGLPDRSDSEDASPSASGPRREGSRPRAAGDASPFVRTRRLAGPGLALRRVSL
jgi:hypothetical protein